MNDNNFELVIEFEESPLKKKKNIELSDKKKKIIDFEVKKKNNNIFQLEQKKEI